MTRLRWWVLAWFALCLGVAVASPLVQPKAMDVVCSNAGGVKIVVHADDGPVKHGAKGMECPLSAGVCSTRTPASTVAGTSAAGTPAPAPVLRAYRGRHGGATPARAPPFFLSQS